MKGTRRDAPHALTRGHVVISMLALGLLLVMAYAFVRALPGQHTPGRPVLTTDRPQPGARIIPTSETNVSQGLAITFAMRPAPVQAALAEVSFTLRDATTGQPATLAAPPAVWIGFQNALQAPPSKDALTCQDKIKLYASGALDSRPEIDLNSYFILALNSDATISVIDPLNGVTGISQLYAMVLLKSRGEDWVMSRDGKRLFVTMPQAGQVAIVDTDSFKVLANVDVGPNPVRIALQPDGRYLWVSNDSTAANAGGVTVVDAEKLDVVARIATGAGQHTLAFSDAAGDAHPHGTGTSPADQTSHAFVANSQAGTVSVIDTQRFQRHADVVVGLHPTALDFSSVSHALYVAGATENTIAVIDVASEAIIARIDAAPGIRAIRFDPSGRWGFAVSPASNRVDVIDASSNRLVHSAKVEGAPDRVSFTQGYAYVHTSQKPDVALFDLAQVGRSDQLSPVMIIGGQLPPDQSPSPLAVADTIISVHEHGNHVLIANPGDRSIYYYMEGMNAPMGTFENYGHTPRAVRVVDRSIRETAPGVYAANVRIPRSGQYQVAFLLDSPRVVHCFAFNTEADAPAVDNPGAEALTLRFLNEERTIQAGERFTLRFALADAGTQAPVADLTDITILATLASGQHSERSRAESVGKGLYESQLLLPAAGFYRVYISIPSRQVDAGDLPALTLRVTPSIGSQ